MLSCHDHQMSGYISDVTVITAPDCSVVTCPEGAVFPPGAGAGVCPRPDSAPDSGDQSDRPDLLLDLRGQGLGLDLAHLKSYYVVFFLI